MGSSTSKIECIWLPGQSGKTRTMQNLIKEFRNLADLFYSCEGFLNIIICSNNRSLVRQTGSRMSRDLYPAGAGAGPVSDSDESDSNETADAQIQGSVFSWFSGIKKSNISPKELADDVKEGVVDMVICCAHKRRLQYLAELIGNLQRSTHFTKKINIWIDEADASMNLWSQDEFQCVLQYDRVNKITLVSATFDSIRKKYGRIKVLGTHQLGILNTTNIATYHGIEDCDIVESDLLADTAPEYIKAVYTTYRETLCRPGVRLFAPGDIERKTHDEIAEFLGLQGFAVVILNGTRKEVLIPNRRPIKLDGYIESDNIEEEEIGKKIAKIYHDNNLAEYPFAITGQLCLGRGLTFQNERFLFDFGILPYIADKANAYQCACRMAGNIRLYEGYKTPTLVTTSLMHAVIVNQERIAKNIARLVTECNLQDVGDEEVAYAAGNTIDYGKKDVPIVIQLTEEDIHNFKSETAKNKKRYARYYLRCIDEVLGKRLKKYTCNKISCPRSEASYKDHITRLVKMAAEKKPGFKDLDVADKDKNVWQVFVDDREFRLVYQIYHGATPKPLGGWTSAAFDITGGSSASSSAAYNPFD